MVSLAKRSDLFTLRAKWSYYTDKPLSHRPVAVHPFLFVSHCVMSRLDLNLLGAETCCYFFVFNKVLFSHDLIGRK